MTAKSQLVCYTLTRKSFDSLLGPIQDVWRFEALRKVPILFSLSNSQLFGLAQCMKYHTLQAGQVVFKKGEPGEPTYAHDVPFVMALLLTLLAFGLNIPLKNTMVCKARYPMNHC